ncbi:MAG: sigma-54 dependent transcriptional regulator [candidate division WOR-3 bacterium]
MSAGRILVIDDEEIMRESLSDWLKEDGYEVLAVEDGIKGLEQAKTGEWNVILLDLKMPKMDGLEVLREIKKLKLDIPVIIITAYATVDTAVAAIKEGAYDYIVKPFHPDEVGLLIKKIIERQNLIKENIILRKELTRRYEFCDIIGKSAKMQAVFELIKTIAPTRSTVLIEGESGTGKELVARAIHASSLRSDAPFIALACGALPETLLEAELFGYEKGAFTGAVSLKKGKLELADGGTLFLDEIGDINLKTQVDLLRFLQEREFRRLGGSELIKVDVRIIAATNKNLKELVNQGKFRNDLYYRLNVFTITLPPLRERKEDIPLLVAHFIEKYRIENAKDIERISEPALQILMDYDWPGNVRQLENAIEHAVVIARGNIIQPEDLPTNLLKKEKSAGPAANNKPLTLDEMEKQHIINVLKQTNNNISRAAEILGINRATLYRKIKEYNIEVN